MEQKEQLMCKFDCKLGGLGDLGQSVRALAKSFRCSISKKIVGKDLTWVVEEGIGQVLLYSGVHCVGIDCSRRLVFDCSKTHALPLTMRL